MICRSDTTSRIDVLVGERIIIYNKHKIERKTTSVACKFEVPTTRAKQRNKSVIEELQIHKNAGCLKNSTWVLSASWGSLPVSVTFSLAIGASSEVWTVSNRALELLMTTGRSFDEELRLLELEKVGATIGG